MDLHAIDLMIPTSARAFSRPGWRFEFKYDGYRILASKTQLITRNKKDATEWYPEIVQALSKLRGAFVIDGKISLLDERGIPNFEAIRGRTRKPKRDRAVTYFAFDLPFLNGRDLRSRPLLERKARLETLLPKNDAHLRYIEHLLDEGEAMLSGRQSPSSGGREPRFPTGNRDCGRLPTLCAPSRITPSAGQWGALASCYSAQRSAGSTR